MQATQQPGIPLPRLIVPDREPQGLLLPNDHEQPLGTGDACVDQVALQQYEVLHCHWDEHRGKLRALRLVDGDRVRQRDFVQLPEVVRHQPVIEPYPKQSR